MNRKKIEQRIERMYDLSCSGVQINIMDIGKVFAEGHRLVTQGCTDEQLGDGLRAFVDTIRHN